MAFAIYPEVHQAHVVQNFPDTYSLKLLQLEISHRLQAGQVRCCACAFCHLLCWACSNTSTPSSALPPTAQHMLLSYSCAKLKSLGFSLMEKSVLPNWNPVQRYTAKVKRRQFVTYILPSSPNYLLYVSTRVNLGLRSLWNMNLSSSSCKLNRGPVSLQ